MPKTWLYFIALVLPLLVRILILNTDFVDNLWYNHHVDAYNLFNVLRTSPLFLELIGGWIFPFFVATSWGYWYLDDTEGKEPGGMFVLLPLIYVPFAIIGSVLVSGHFDVMTLFSYPVVILIFGYLYVFPWMFCIWVFSKTGVVL
jgi:hypothetical protein